MQRNPQDTRRRDFKKTLQASDARKKREDVTIALRKNKRDDAVAKRRNIVTASAAVGEEAVDPALLPQMVQLLYETNDVQRLFEATSSIRKMLSVPKDPPIAEVVAANVLPRFVEMLQDDSNPALQLEAAWVLTNVAAGTTDQSRVVAESGAVSEFVRMLSSSASAEVCEQAMWALGNIAGDSPTMRDFVLQNDAMTPLLAWICNEQIQPPMLRNAVWVLSNLFRGKPQPPLELVQAAVPILVNLVQHIQDDQVLLDACWSLGYLSEGSVQALIDANVVRRVVELLEHTDSGVQTAILRIVGNIVTGDDLQTQLVVSIGALQSLHPLLSSDHKSIRKEACWVISNITAGTVAQIQEAIDANLVPVLVQLMTQDEFAIKKEAAWAISNTTTNGTVNQIRYLVREGVIAPLCDLLSCVEPATINVALEALENILAVGESDLANYGMNPYCIMIEETGGLDRIELLQSHVNNQIYDRSGAMLTRFFGAAERENFDEVAQPPLALDPPDMGDRLRTAGMSAAGQQLAMGMALPWEARYTAVDDGGIRSDMGDRLRIEGIPAAGQLEFNVPAVANFSLGT